jgi:integrase/recombinase XerD
MAVRYNRRWEEMDKSSTTLEALFKTYALYNRSEGRCASTIAWYEGKLRTFQQWLEEQGQRADLGGFARPNVREFVLYLQEKEEKHEHNPFVPTKRERLSSHTVRGYVRALKAFSSWLHDEGYADENVLKGYKGPKAKQVEHQWLREDEIERLLGLFNRRTTIGSRDYAIAVTLLDTGLRCGELCGLTLEGANLDLGDLKVLGKGNKERTVPVGVRAVRALRRYRDHFRPEVETTRFLLSIDGRPLTVNAVKQMVKKAGQLAGIPRVHPHLLRHTFAIHYLMAGGDAFSLQKILGHTSLEVTRMYVNMVDGQVKEKHRLYSPMDNLALKGERVGRKAARPGARLWVVRRGRPVPSGANRCPR